MDYENTKEQAICCSITYLWVLAGTYRQRCNSISILCVYRNTVVLCKRKLDLLRIEPLTTALFFCRAKFTSLIMRDGLAQLVERRPYKADATGSSPVPPTSEFNPLRTHLRKGFLVFRSRPERLLS